VVRPGERTGYPGLFSSAGDRDFSLLVEGVVTDAMALAWHNCLEVERAKVRARYVGA
jgi:hypothetical protein